MSHELTLIEIAPEATTAVPTAAQMSHGIPIPPVRLLRAMSPDDWEQFTEEWLSFHRARGVYHSIRRVSGPRDLGLDVVAFTSVAGFAAPWDSFQCKRYFKPLQPLDICPDVAKVIYHSFRRTAPFNQLSRVPRRYVFVSPEGTGITVSRWLRDPALFKRSVRDRWDKDCAPHISAALRPFLSGEFLDYFEDFDFSIFEDRSAIELLEEHAETRFHTARFGSGLPPRDQTKSPPTEPAAIESVYLTKLLAAYSDSLGRPVIEAASLQSHPHLKAHYNRQRVLFYSAESLRNFARDRTPPNTFGSLQEDVYFGVVDVCETVHADAMSRLRNTLSTAAQLDIAGNALSSVTHVADKQGICHQLANDCRLTWIQGP